MIQIILFQMFKAIQQIGRKVIHSTNDCPNTIHIKWTKNIHNNNHCWPSDYEKHVAQATAD